MVAGVTYNPITNDLFWVEKGKGAYLGAEKRLRVAARRHLDESILATGVPFLGKPGHAQFLKELHQISQKVAGVRRFGAASLDLAWVAAGRFDGYWERNIKPWDVAAGVLMVTESGGKVSDHRGARRPGRGRLDPGVQPGTAPAGAGAAGGGPGLTTTVHHLLSSRKARSAPDR